MKFLIQVHNIPSWAGAGTVVLLVLAAVLLHGCSGSNEQRDPALAELEQQMVVAVNRYRNSIGLNSLVSKETIAVQARIHSRNMAADKVPLAHDGATERTERIGETILWATISENVAFSTQRDDLVDFVLNRWLNSPGHRKNIEGEFNLTGIGVALSPDGRYFFTQIFVLTQ